MISSTELAGKIARVASMLEGGKRQHAGRNEKQLSSISTAGAEKQTQPNFPATKQLNDKRPTFPYLAGASATAPPSQDAAHVLLEQLHPRWKVRIGLLVSGDPHL